METTSPLTTSLVGLMTVRCHGGIVLLHIQILDGSPSINSVGYLADRFTAKNIKWL